MNIKTKTWPIIILIFSLIGLGDSSYLTWEHFQTAPVPCKIPIFPFLTTLTDCGQVLNSQYAQIGPIPTAAFGMLFYVSVLVTTLSILIQPHLYIQLKRKFLLLISIAGILTSAILVYLQLFVIHAICLYCMLSAFTTLIIFITTLKLNLTPLEQQSS